MGDIKYDGSSIVPTDVGIYAITADFTSNDANYESLDDVTVGDFEIEPSATLHTVTVLASPAEGGSASGDGIYAEGSRVTVTAIANPGFEFVNWTEDDVIISTNSTYRFNMGR